MKTAVPGPTYQEMLHPELLPAAIRSAALAGAATELDPINLFNITWRGADNQVRHVVLPKELTGVRPTSWCWWAGTFRPGATRWVRRTPR